MRHIALSIVLAGACFAPTRQAAPCVSDENCNLSAGGQCLPSPLGSDQCAYPSPDCPGGLAWGELSPDLNRACVQTDAGVDAVPDASGGPITSNFAFADLIIGQSGFGVTELRGFAANSITATDVAAHRDGVWLSDNEHNRLLFFSPLPSSPDPVASIVIGRPSFADNTPLGAPSATNLDGSGGISVAGGGKLIVSDHYRHRVMIWSRPPATSGVAADIVLGQASMLTGDPGGGASGLRFPAGVWSDGTRLVVADSGNHRVLIWTSFPTRNGQPADIVLGQPDFSAVAAPPAPTASAMRAPWSVTSDGARLFVGDIDFRRVTMWNSFPAANGEAADVVIGQTSLTTSELVPASPSYLMSPLALAVYRDALLVSDRGNWRVAIWQPVPTTSGASAALVLGQSDLSTNTQPKVPSQQRIRGPAGLAIEGNKLFVGDDLARRALRFPLQ